MVDLLKQFEKYPEFRVHDGVKLTGQQLAEDLAAGLSVKIEAVLAGDLHLNPEKTYLVRPWLNQGVEDIKIATPEGPSNGQLITSRGQFRTHSS